MGVANESHKAIHQLHSVNDFHQNIYAILNRLRLISTIMNFELISFSQPEIYAHFDKRVLLKKITLPDMFSRKMTEEIDFQNP